MANLFEKPNPQKQSAYTPSDFSLWLREQNEEVQNLILTEVNEELVKRQQKNSNNENLLVGKDIEKSQSGSFIAGKERTEVKKRIALKYGYYPRS